MVVPLYCFDRIALRQFDLVDGVAHLHDGVNRALFPARDIAGHVNDGLQILAIDTGVNRGLPQVRDFLQCDLPSGSGGQFDVFQVLDARAIGPRQPHVDRNVLARLRIVQESGARAAQSHLQRARDISGRDSVQRRLVKIDFQVVLGLRIFDVPVHIHHAGVC